MLMAKLHQLKSKDFLHEMTDDQRHQWAKNIVNRMMAAWQVTEHKKMLLSKLRKGDKYLSDIIEIVFNKTYGFNISLVYDNSVCNTINTKVDNVIRVYDKKHFSILDWLNVGTFPKDYNFIKKSNIPYLIGMSVPPIMTANIANEIYKQLLNTDKGV